jgi:hypothetical protein
VVGFRDIKREARRDLHRELEVPALYIATSGDTPVPVTIRIHSKWDALGDQKGTSFNSAERAERLPSIIFMRDQVPAPRRNAIVSVERGEAYQLGYTQPPDDLTITAAMIEYKGDDLMVLPLPGDDL